MLHPDRNFSTIASQGLAVEQVMAQLEHAKTGALLAGEPARRALFCDADTCAEMLEVRRTLRMDSTGSIEADELRPWLKAPASGDGLRVVVNEGAGPYLCRPPQMGADIVVEDLGDLFGEAFEGLAFVAARSEGALERFLRAIGADAPDAAAPVLPGVRDLLAHMLPQLALVTQARCDRALVAAQFLAHHPRVVWVRYPGLAEDASNAEARRSMEHGFGWRVAFKPAEDARGFACGLWESPLGALSSRVEVLPDGACVLHAGLEEALDVVGALEKGIACPKPTEDCA